MSVSNRHVQKLQGGKNIGTDLEDKNSYADPQLQKCTQSLLYTISVLRHSTYREKVKITILRIKPNGT